MNANERRLEILLAMLDEAIAKGWTREAEEIAETLWLEATDETR